MQSVLLAGGGTMLPTIDKRIGASIADLKIRHGNRIHGNWIGAEILSHISSFRFYTRDQYLE